MISTEHQAIIDRRAGKLKGDLTAWRLDGPGSNSPLLSGHLQNILMAGFHNLTNVMYHLPSLAQEHDREGASALAGATLMDHIMASDDIKRLSVDSHQKTLRVRYLTGGIINQALAATRAVGIETDIPPELFGLSEADCQRHGLQPLGMST